MRGCVVMLCGAVLFLVAVPCVIAICYWGNWKNIDLEDPFGLCNRGIYGRYYLNQFPEGDAFYAVYMKNVESPMNGVLEATADEMGRDGHLLYVRVRPNSPSSKEGVYCINMETDEITGPLKREEYDHVRFYPIQVFWDSL